MCVCVFVCVCVCVCVVIVMIEGIYIVPICHLKREARACICVACFINFADLHLHRGVRGQGRLGMEDEKEVQ